MMSCIFLACSGVPGTKPSNSYNCSLTCYWMKVRTLHMRIGGSGALGDPSDHYRQVSSLSRQGVFP